MTKRWMYEESPISLLATRREELSDVLRNWIKIDAEDRHWLGVWIAEYDKAIAKINAESEAGDECAKRV